MKNKKIGVAAVFMMPVVLYLIFSLAAPGFGLHSLTMVLNQCLTPTVIGFGMAILMQCGLMDFSIGCRTIFAVVWGGLFAQYLGVFGFLVGAAVGAILSSLILAVLFRLLRIPSMILGMGFVLLGECLNYEMAGIYGSNANVSFNGTITAPFRYPFNLIWVLAAAVLFYFILYRTKVGFQISAVGSDELLSKSVGIHPAKVKSKAYLISGIFVIFAACMQIGAASIVTNMTNMASMAAAFQPLIGVMIGMPLLGLINCYPLVIILGEFCVAIIFNGLIAMGVSDNIQGIVLGLFLLLVMAVSGNIPGLKETIRRSRVRRLGVSAYGAVNKLK